MGGRWDGLNIKVPHAGSGADSLLNKLNCASELHMYLNSVLLLLLVKL